MGSDAMEQVLCSQYHGHIARDHWIGQKFTGQQKEFFTDMEDSMIDMRGLYLKRQFLSAHQT